MITEKAMLAAVHISIWTAVKHDRKVSRDVADQHGAHQGAGRYNKQLLRGADKLDELRMLAGQIRQYFYKITLPWSDEGFRLLPANFYFDLMARMREFEASFEQGVESFLRVYPQYIEQVRPELNGLFREEDYPVAEKLRAKFGLKVEILPIPTGADFRVQMLAEEQARVAREIDASVRESLTRGTEDLWRRVREADETPHGKRWIFQDVHSGGAASIAGIQPGDILLSVDRREMIPPEHPVFAMGTQAEVEIVGGNDDRRAVAVNVARPKGKKLHFVEPTLVEGRQLGKGIGYLKIAMFPDMVGVKVANEISTAVTKLGPVESLIIDLRGNTGGGLGALRGMSLLTPDRIPVGFALDRCRVTANLESKKQGFRRFSRIPSSPKTLWLLAVQFAPAMMTKRPIVLQTEGLGKQPFHGKLILLVDRHTASAAEMIVAFARENKLAMIVGEKTAGRLLSATSVKVGNGFRLALPTGAYYTWKGSILEGTPTEPDELVEFDWRQTRLGRDIQLERAVGKLEMNLLSKQTN